MKLVQGLRPLFKQPLIGIRNGRIFRRKEGELLKIRIYLQTWKPVEECTKRESEKDFGYLASERKEEEQC